MYWRFSVVEWTFVWLLMIVESVQARGEHIDPFADPKNDPYNPLRYIPADGLTTIAVVLFLATTSALWLCMRKWGGQYWWPMILGGYSFSLGLILRYPLARDPHELGLFIPMHLLIVLSPCLFIAAIYMLLGRLATHVDAGNHLLITPNKVTLLFVLSDIVTFIIQATGGSFSVSVNPQMRLAGNKMLVAGLALQCASFFIFILIFGIFVWRVAFYAPVIWSCHKVAGRPWYLDWRTLVCAMALSCVGIEIRCVYRVMEFAEGVAGPLSTNEGLLYGLDTYPLLASIIVYVPLWPARILSGKFDSRLVAKQPGAEQLSSLETFAMEERQEKRGPPGIPQGW